MNTNSSVIQREALNLRKLKTLSFEGIVTNK